MVHMLNPCAIDTLLGVNLQTGGSQRVACGFWRGVVERLALTPSQVHSPCPLLGTAALPRPVAGALGLYLEPVQRRNGAPALYRLQGLLLSPGLDGRSALSRLRPHTLVSCQVEDICAIRELYGRHVRR